MQKAPDEEGEGCILMPVAIRENSGAILLAPAHHVPL